MVPPYLFKIPGCKRDACILAEFKQLTASKIPENWENECKVGFQGYHGLFPGNQPQMHCIVPCKGGPGMMSNTGMTSGTYI